MDQETREFLEESFGRIGARLDGVDQRFETIDRQAERVDQQFDDLRSDFVQRFETIDQQFDDLRNDFDQRFETIDQQFERVGQRFETIDQQFERVDQRFETIDRRFDQVDRRFDALEEETRHTRVLVEGLQTQLQAIAEGFATVDSKIGRTAASLRDEVEEDRSRNTQLHRHHERRISDVERRVDLLEATED